MLYDCQVPSSLLRERKTDRILIYNIYKEINDCIPCGGFTIASNLQCIETALYVCIYLYIQRCIYILNHYIHLYCPF